MWLVKTCLHGRPKQTFFWWGQSVCAQRAIASVSISGQTVVDGVTHFVCNHPPWSAVAGFVSLQQPHTTSAFAEDSLQDVTCPGSTTDVILSLHANYSRSFIRFLFIYFVVRTVLQILEHIIFASFKLRIWISKWGKSHPGINCQGQNVKALLEQKWVNTVQTARPHSQGQALVCLKLGVSGRWRTSLCFGESRLADCDVFLVQYLKHRDTHLFNLLMPGSFLHASFGSCLFNLFLSDIVERIWLKQKWF